MPELDRCQNGYCDQTTGVCAPYKAATEPCTYSDQCPEGSGCVSTAAMPNPVCRTLVPTNGPCTQSAECLLQGDVCKNGACMPGGLVGSTCATQGECQSFHACSNNQCAQAPGIGQSCLGVGVCTEGYCSFSGDPTMPMCAPKVPDLGTCMVDQGLVQCESRYCNAGKCDQKPVCN